MRAIIEYIIVAVFAAQGCMIAKKQKCGLVKTFIVSLSFCFGGGFWLRDIFLLHGAAGIGVFDNLKYVVFSLVCIIAIQLPFVRRIVAKCNRYICVVDWIGSFLWIIDGMERAMPISSNLFVIIGCGLCTAFGGGIIGKFIANVNTQEIISYKSIYTVSSVVIAAHFLKTQPAITTTINLTVALGILAIWRISSDRALKNSVIANLNEIIWFNGAVENTFCVDYTKSYNDVCCFSTLLVHSLMKDTKTVQPVCSRSLIPAKRILYHFRLPKSNNLTK